MVDEAIGGVEFVGINTDKQALTLCKKLYLLYFRSVKRSPKDSVPAHSLRLGQKAAEESVDEVRRLIEGADMVFVTCGMGGGTGTGAAPIVAGLAKEMGILTVGVVTKAVPF